MKHRILLVLVLVFSALQVQAAGAREQVGITLDAFHAAAADASERRYFDLMIEDVVFLGTDGTERWQGQAFRDFVSGHFSKGRGWSYRTTQRNIAVAPDGQSAWFDELLENEHLGQCRGSGTLLLTGQGWKITQYNLSMPVPNNMAGQLAAKIRGEKE